MFVYAHGDDVVLGRIFTPNRNIWSAVVQKSGECATLGDFILCYSVGSIKADDMVVTYCEGNFRSAYD